MKSKLDDVNMCHNPDPCAPHCPGARALSSWGHGHSGHLSKLVFPVQIQTETQGVFFDRNTESSGASEDWVSFLGRALLRVSRQCPRCPWLLPGSWPSRAASLWCPRWSPTPGMDPSPLSACTTGPRTAPWPGLPLWVSGESWGRTGCWTALRGEGGREQKRDGEW